MAGSRERTAWDLGALRAVRLLKLARHFSRHDRHRFFLPPLLVRGENARRHWVCIALFTLTDEANLVSYKGRVILRDLGLESCASKVAISIRRGRSSKPQFKCYDLGSGRST